MTGIPDRAHDGIQSMVPREQMSEAVRKLRDTYSITPGPPLYHKEFGFYCLEQWYKQGLSPDADRAQEFYYDPPAVHAIGELGWCEPSLYPEFEDEVIEDRGEHEVIQDKTGRHLLVFKGRRNGFMPEYMDHPVKDMKTWRELIKWRMDPDTPERYTDLDERMSRAREKAGMGWIISQRIVGGYMFLRSLIGPEQLFYAVYDMPDVIHECMETWLSLADTVIAKHQEHVTIEEIFFAEDICYNHGPLISIDMIKEFLFPYYKKLVNNIKSRQIDPKRHLYVAVDTDGYAVPIIEPYKEAIGMDVMTPFEVASGCDVVKIGKAYPWLVISGGIDKRILAQGKKKIDEHLNYIFPVMRERGGYIPTCDHGVPEEVTLENYRYYRERMIELGG